jgi:hypothetical protein
MPPSTLAAAEDKADEPQDQEDACHDPQDVEREAEPGKDQNQQERQQDDHPIFSFFVSFVKLLRCTRLFDVGV